MDEGYEEQIKEDEDLKGFLFFWKDNSFREMKGDERAEEETEQRCVLVTENRMLPHKFAHIIYQQPPCSVSDRHSHTDCTERRQDDG